jgi:DNA modification methylase
MEKKEYIRARKLSRRSGMRLVEFTRLLKRRSIMKKAPQINMFTGEAEVEKGRDIEGEFGVVPFSILKATAGKWQARKKKWNILIGDDGMEREGALFGVVPKAGTTEVDEKIKTMAKGVSILDASLAEILLSWFTNTGFRTYDPFAGDTVFGFVSGYMNRPFTGIELRQEQVDANQSRCDNYKLDAHYICDTSENMDLHIEDSSMDFVFSCPPYADLEKYSDLKEDLSNMSHDEFFKVYRRILMNTYSKLKPDRFACIVMGEVRGLDGSLLGTVPNTIDFMREAGYKYWNEIILANSVGTLPLRICRQMNANRKIGRRHQTVLIFYKGDTSKIKKNFPSLIKENEYYEGRDNK